MSPRSRLLLSAWAPPAAWCLLIFALSSLSLRTDGDLPAGSDRAAHFAEYGVLGWLTVRALFLSGPGRPPTLPVLLGAFLATAWGATDEIHQAFVPERSAEWGDLLADGAGALAGGVLFAALRRRGAARPMESGSGAAPSPRPPAPGRPPAR